MRGLQNSKFIPCIFVCKENLLQKLQSNIQKEKKIRIHDSENDFSHSTTVSQLIAECKQNLVNGFHRIVLFPLSFLNSNSGTQPQKHHIQNFWTLLRSAPTCSGKRINKSLNRINRNTRFMTAITVSFPYLTSSDYIKTNWKIIPQLLR